jgi:pimeloyl-ACP methyl ester carboxylesterase
MRLEVGGTEIAYDVQGDGPAVLFLHAFPLSRAMWDVQVASFSRRYRVVRVDARGFGESALGSGPLSMEEIAEAAIRVLDAAGISQAVVCGLSMGGYAALAMVRLFQERIRGLVLSDTKAGADNDEARRNRAALADCVREHGSSAAVEAMLPKILGATTHRQRPEVVRRVEQAMGAAPRQAVVNALAGLAARPDATGTLTAIRAPTLVLCGVEDVLTPVADAEALHRAIAGSRLVVLPGAGHLSNLESPEVFDRELGAFLGSFG